MEMERERDGERERWRGRGMEMEREKEMERERDGEREKTRDMSASTVERSCVCFSTVVEIDFPCHSCCCSILLGRVTYISEACHVYECVLSHLANESSRPYE